MSWYYIAGQLAIDEARQYAQSLIEGDPILYDGIDLQVMLKGGVDLVLRLDRIPQIPSALKVRKVTYAEACWHMLDRVRRVCARLSDYQRKQSRLGWWYRLTDLHGAYIRASQYRGISYRQWQAINRLTSKDAAHAASFIAQHPQLPVLDIRVFGDKQSAAYQQTLTSLEQQWYARFRLLADAGHSESNWLLCLQAGDELSQHALLWFACTAMAHGDATMIYADDDCWQQDRGVQPRFKPDWSALTYLYHDFVGNAAMLNAAVLKQQGLLSTVIDIAAVRKVLLTLLQHMAVNVQHIPAPLLHTVHAPSFNLPVAPEVTLSSAPLISIIIPTRDATDYVQRCLNSVLQCSSYQHFEIIVVDNGSTDPALHSYLQAVCHQDVRVSVLRDDRPFNYSALNNHAVTQARGEWICFLNNDIALITADWLEQMLAVVQQHPQVGVVGAKLYYADDTIQHAGVIVGAGGCANHLNAFRSRDEPGYCQRASHVQELLAVTAACMLTSKALFVSLNGFNETHLPVAFNDVDYCLRVRAAGYHVMWTPFAELYHFESVSRRKDQTPQRKKQAEREVEYMRKQWAGWMRKDPFYNPNFTYLRPDFVLAPVPDVRFPWSR